MINLYLTDLSLYPWLILKLNKVLLMSNNLPFPHTKFILILPYNYFHRVGLFSQISVKLCASVQSNVLFRSNCP